MASNRSDVGMHVTLLGDKSTGRVLYMEAGKDFVDFLFSLLLLPQTTILKLLIDNGLVEESGSSFAGIANLYVSFAKLRKVFLHVEKSEIFSPNLPCSYKPSLLQIKNMASNDTVYYRCSNSRDTYDSHHGSYKNTACRNNISTSRGVQCETCKSGHFTVPVQIVQSSESSQGASAKSVVKGFVKETVTFIVTDELEVFPASTIKTFGLLNKLKLGRLENLESLEVEVDTVKALRIVYAAMKGTTVLNDVFGGAFKKAVEH